MTTVQIWDEGAWRELAGIKRVAFEHYRQPIEQGIDSIRTALAAPPPERSPIEVALDILWPHLILEPLFRPYTWGSGPGPF